MDNAKNEEKQKKILILCVDRDDDLEKKAGVKTPVIGRKRNLEAAIKLALSDPEEPDANAMFEAMRTYDKLKDESKPEEDFEIAAISGSEIGGVTADRKIAAELEQLLDTFSATEIILVVDGYSDEAVLPLIQSRVPVTSVSRIIIKHSESIEETAALFSRYLKMIWENPRFSRLLLGIPGLLILVAGILSIFNFLSIFWIFFVLILSTVMVVRGFGADKAAKSFYRWVKEYSPPPLRVQISGFSTGAGALCIVIGAYRGWTNASIALPQLGSPSDFAGWLSVLPPITGHFIQGSMDLLVVGVCVALLGRAIRWYLEHDARLLRNAALMVTVAWSRQILDGTSVVLTGGNYDELVFSVIVGILIGVASVLVIFVIHRSSKGFFKDTEEQAEEFGED
jgi:putative membrane protein